MLQNIHRWKILRESKSTRGTEVIYWFEQYVERARPRKTESPTWVARENRTPTNCCDTLSRKYSTSIFLTSGRGSSGGQGHWGKHPKCPWWWEEPWGTMNVDEHAAGRQCSGRSWDKLSGLGCMVHEGATASIQNVSKAWAEPSRGWRNTSEQVEEWRRALLSSAG